MRSSVDGEYILKDNEDPGKLVLLLNCAGGGGYRPLLRNVSALRNGGWVG